MDTTLVKTFLEVAAAGSFVSAAERLFVAQSAVSLRIQRLEQELGKRLFERSKAGADMTPAGREFERYALSLLKVWEEARQQVGIPQGYNRSLTIGAQFSLWPRLGFRWVDGLRANVPELSLRLELGMPERLMRMLVQGSLQVGLMYTPQLRPGLMADRVMDDELVLVASWAQPTLDLEGRYVFVDWGEEFVHAHALAMPGLTNPGLTMALEAMSAEYLIGRSAAAYLPARYVRRYVSQGLLHLVPDAPSFPYPLWALWRDDIEEGLAEIARDTLASAAERADADQDAVIDELCEISNTNEIEVLGETRDLIPEKNSS
ncbi:LysR family transcriptional regulator [Roseivivax sp. CAU 1761]